MTVGQLIRELEGMDENAEVRLAHQPHWPFEYSVGEVIWSGDHDPRDEYDILRDDDGWHIEDTTEGEQLEGPFETVELAEEKLNEMLSSAEPTPNVAYIAEAGQLDYLPGWASRTLGWR